MLHTLSSICDIIDVLNKRNKYLSVISLSFLKAFAIKLVGIFIFSALQKFRYGYKFIHMIKVR